MSDSSSFEANIITNTVDSTGSTVVSAVQSNVIESTTVSANVVTGGQGLQGIPGVPGTTNHLLLTNIGTNTHAQIDSFISATTATLAARLPVSGTTNGDIFVDYIGGKTDPNVTFDVNGNFLGTLTKNGVNVSLVGHVHTVSDITATGTPNSTTYLRGDGVWSTLAGGGGGGTNATNLAATLSSANIIITSDTGTDATIPAVDGTNAGVMTPTQKTKLDGIASGAEVNVNADWTSVSGDAQILNKPTTFTPSTHSHTATDLPTASETAKGIVELATSVETTAGLVVQASDTRLSDARTPISHNHTASNVTDFSTAADARITAATGVSVQGYNANTTTLGNTTTGTGSIVRANSPALVTPTGIVKGDVGLGNVDNTSDATKNAAVATITNKNISGASNTFSNIGVTTISATGTANATTYLRGDAVWGPVTGGSSIVVASSTTSTKIKATADYVCDGTADNVEIQAALNTGKYVELTDGTFNLAAGLTITTSDTVLKGAGFGQTKLVLANAVNATVLTISGSGVISVTICDLLINGNKANNTAGHGIYLNTPWTSTDAMHYFYNLDVINAKQDGIKIEGDTRATRWQQVRSKWADGNGFALAGSDHQFVTCFADAPKLSGYVIYGANINLVGCKAFYAGQTVGGPAGFRIESPRTFLTACEAQDNYEHGFRLLVATGSSLTGCVADSNGQGYVGAGSGLSIESSNGVSVSGGTFFDRAANTNKQAYGIVISGTSTGVIVSGEAYSGNVTGTYNDTSSGTNNRGLSDKATQTLTNKTIIATTNNVAAKSLHSATTVVDVFGATAPTSGQVLTATSSTAATWQTPSGGGSAAIAMGHSPGDASGHVGAPQQWFVNLFTATNTQSVTTLKGYCVNVSGSNTVQMGLYNEAGTLLSSGTATVTTAGGFTVTLASSVSLTKGTNYWSGLCNQTNTAGTTFAYFTSNPNTTALNRYAGGAALPATLTAGNTTATAFCIMVY